MSLKEVFTEVAAGFEAARGMDSDFGDTGYIAKVPDIGEDPSYDF